MSVPSLHRVTDSQYYFVQITRIQGGVMPDVVRMLKVMGKHHSKQATLMANPLAFLGLCITLTAYS